MLYYSFTVTVKELETDSDSRRDRAFCEKINTAVQRANEKMDYNVKFFVTGYNNNVKTFSLAGVIGSKNTRDPGELAAKFVEELGYEFVEADGQEITIRDFAKLIHIADRGSFIDDEDEVLFRAAIGPMRLCMSDSFSEAFATLGKGKTLEQEVASLHCGSSLEEEIKRINNPEAPHEFIGHPVHYIIYCDDKNSGMQIVRILVDTLYSAGRLRSKRTVLINSAPRRSPMERFMGDDDESCFNRGYMSSLYRHQGGCTVVSSLGKLGIEADVLTENAGCVEDAANIIMEHHMDTLSVLIFKKTEKLTAERLKWALPELRFVEIEEETFFGAEAKKILAEKAEEDNIFFYDSLLKLIDDDGKGYSMSDVESLYRKWLTDRLPNEVYPQYSVIVPTVRKAAELKGSAYDRLNSLVGLKSAKETIKKVVDYTKVLKLYKDAGFNSKSMSKHMIFTGNPGTAKTTVARLFAQIMKDNGVLAKGDLIEVGRQDLVGKYVGWTAKLVEEAFKRADGSVLFIDEAYSLCDGETKTFGTEAINAIVQLMENRRDRTIVIFAGYPDKMETFLNENPGLRSRIAFHVNFDDYSDEELVDILKLQAADNGVEFSDRVEDTALALFRTAKESPDFGQGRYVRNLFEQARMNQASRIVAMNTSDVTPSVLKTLIPEDFSGLRVSEKKTARPIGFSLN